MTPLLCCIVVKSKVNEDNHIYGPFHDQEQACQWAHEECKGLEWHWLPLNRPGSIFATADADDIQDFIETATKRDDCYVQVDGVSWVIPKKN